MKKTLVTMFALFAPAAYAGCADFTDGSLGDTPAPKYRICYDGVCEETTQDYVCSSVNSYQAGYAIGWAVDCQIESGNTDKQACVITWENRAIDPAKHDRLTFVEIPD